MHKIFLYYQYYEIFITHEYNTLVAFNLIFRIPSLKEEIWIKKYCRKAWDESVPFRPELYEEWYTNDCFPLKTCRSKVDYHFPKDIPKIWDDMPPLNYSDKEEFSEPEDEDEGHSSNHWSTESIPGSIMSFVSKIKARHEKVVELPFNLPETHNLVVPSKSALKFEKFKY